MKAIQVCNITKKYGDIKVLENFSMDVNEQEMVCIIGESGCGKSTLLNIIGLLEEADSGSVLYLGEREIKPYSRKAEKMLRYDIGYLFQNFALIEDESVENNLMMALTYQKRIDKKKAIATALKEVGLEGAQLKKICQCSGGEQQRIAIARILLKPCNIILADEPTGSLDPHNKKIVIDLLKKLKEKGKTIVVVTHDEEMASCADRIIKLEKRKIIDNV